MSEKEADEGGVEIERGIERDRERGGEEIDREQE